MKDHSSSSRSSSRRSHRYYDRRSRSRSRSRERSSRRHEKSPSSQSQHRQKANKLASEKLKTRIQQQLNEAKSDLKKMSSVKQEDAGEKEAPLLSFEDQLKRANAIQEMNEPDFQPKCFVGGQLNDNNANDNINLADIPMPPSLNWRENPHLVIHPSVRSFHFMRFFYPLKMVKIKGIKNNSH